VPHKQYAQEILTNLKLFNSSNRNSFSATMYVSVDSCLKPATSMLALLHNKPMPKESNSVRVECRPIYFTDCLDSVAVLKDSRNVAASNFVQFYLIVRQKRCFRNTAWDVIDISNCIFQLKLDGI